MATTRGVGLVLELDRGASRPLELADRAHHVQRAAEPGIGVHDQRQSGHAHDLPRRACQLVERYLAAAASSRIGSRAWPRGYATSRTSPKPSVVVTVTRFGMPAG